MNIPMLTVKQAAQRLNVSATTVYALVKAGNLACHRVGVGRGVIRIAEADVKEYLSECRADVSVGTYVKRRFLKLKHIEL